MLKACVWWPRHQVAPTLLLDYNINITLVCLCVCPSVSYNSVGGLVRLSRTSALRPTLGRAVDRAILLRFCADITRLKHWQYWEYFPTLFQSNCRRSLRKVIVLSWHFPALKWILKISLEDKYKKTSVPFSGGFVLCIGGGLSADVWWLVCGLKWVMCDV